MNRCGTRQLGLAALAVVVLCQPAPGAGQGIGLPKQAGDLPVDIRAADGIEWDQKSRTYTARGSAQAMQGDVSVRAEVLTMHYREDDGGIAVWRINADGDVTLSTPTQRASGRKAVYDVDRGVFTLTGDIRLVTETDHITARDSLQYREREGIVIARGNAMARRGDNALRANVLKARLARGQDDKIRVTRIDAAGRVVITTAQETVRSDRGVYNVESGIVTLTGSVRIVRAPSRLSGDRAEVNLRTGVSRLFGAGSRGVRGVFVPGSQPDGKSGR